MDYLYILKDALVFIVTIFWIYQIGISLCSLIKLKDKPLQTNKKHKFMAIIPAHNEEMVVVSLIESLKNQTYDKDLYDIYVIADNCTDNTAKVAEQAGAIVYKRFDSVNKTKGFALNWFLQQKIKENADYDAFFVFDADNIVDKNFITAMNQKLCEGEDVVQGYRDIKNPTDNWITAGYALFYCFFRKRKIRTFDLHVLSYHSVSMIHVSACRLLNTYHTCYSAIFCLLMHKTRTKHR